ncbi:unnamed protein product [Mortierella alpina]
MPRERSRHHPYRGATPSSPAPSSPPSSSPAAPSSSAPAQPNAQGHRRRRIPLLPVVPPASRPPKGLGHRGRAPHSPVAPAAPSSPPVHSSSGGPSSSPVTAAPSAPSPSPSTSPSTVAPQVIASAGQSASQRSRSEDHIRLEALLSGNFNPRRWECVDPESQATVSVVSYNLLSATLASKDHKFVGSSYAPGQLSWNERCLRLLWEILLLDVDIVCVQELDERNYRNDFGCTMAVYGYAGVFQKRRRDLPHGFAIFLKKARVTLVRECPVPCPQGQLVNNIDHAGLLLVVKVAGTPGPRRMCVATTHILNGEDIGWRRLGQLMSIMAAAEIQLRHHPRMPFVLTGDFNAKLHDSSARFVSRGWVRVPGRCSDEDARRFKQEAGRSDNSSTPLPLPPRLKNIVDHIFYGQIGGSPLMKLVSRLELPESLAQLKNGLPAAHLGSDHFALGAKFYFGNEVDEMDEAEDEEEEEEMEEMEQEYLRLLEDDEYQDQE